MKQLLYYIWLLPLNLIGILYRDILSMFNSCYILDNTKECLVYSSTTKRSFTFGKYIFLGENIIYNETPDIFKDYRKSKTLGPIYLFYLLFK